MDIQVGDVITYKYINDGGKEKNIISKVMEDTYTLKNIIKQQNGYDENCKIEILKIERPKYEVIEEKKELLTEEEKEFLRQFIKFANFIPNKICKEGKTNRILFYISNMIRDSFEYHGAFENLKDEKIYTLKELGVY